MLPTQIQDQLIALLLIWALASLGSATIGLYAQPRERWRAFWLMSGLWGLVDGLIAWFALIGDRQPPAALLPFLRFNTGLDVVYLAVALFLMTRQKPTLRGFGLAILIQGIFLLVLDGTFWWKCAQLAR